MQSFISKYRKDRCVCKTSSIGGYKSMQSIIVGRKSSNRENGNEIKLHRLITAAVFRKFRKCKSQQGMFDKYDREMMVEYT